MSRRSWPISRRRFLRLALAAGTTAVAGGFSSLIPQGTEKGSAESWPATRAVAWTVSRSNFLSPLPGQDDPFLTSPVWTAPFRFNGFGARWDGPEQGAAAPPVIEFRTNDGEGWSPWLAAPMAHGRDGTSGAATDLIGASGTGLQFRLAPGSAETQTLPERVVVTVIDSHAGPAADEADLAPSPAPSSSILAAIANPNQIGRVGWGANESYRFKDGRERWPRVYQEARKLIIHHTATTNGEADPAAMVRAIYYYHAVTLGWGDIGYSFLIDRNGRIYEGRAGGLNTQGLPVMGGHALQYNAGSVGIALIGTFSAGVAVPDAMATALANLVSYKVVQHGIDPTASGFFIDKTLPNIMGHRDCLSTTCPGDAAYALLSSLRTVALANLPPLGQSWVKQRLPAVMVPGAVVNGQVVVRNSGSQLWAKGGASPFRVGYRWFFLDGRELREPGIEIHSDLPKDVPPGQEATVPVRVQVPHTVGTLTLKFDMLQEGVIWFSAVPGNEPLTTSVTVTGDLKYQTRLPWVTRGH